MTTKQILARVTERLADVRHDDLFHDAAADAVTALLQNWTEWERDEPERHDELRLMAVSDIDRTIDALEGLRAHIVGLFS